MWLKFVNYLLLLIGNEQLCVFPYKGLFKFWIWKKWNLWRRWTTSFSTNHSPDLDECIDFIMISNYIQSLISIVFDWSFLILVVILISERNEFHQNSSKVWIRYRCPISGTFCCEVLSGPKNGIDGDCIASRLLKVIFKQIFLQNLTKCMHAWALYGNYIKKSCFFFFFF